VPNFVKLPLWTNFEPGCLLPLTRSPKTSGIISLTNDVRVEIRKGVPAVVVRNLRGIEPTQLLSLGVEAANAALDLFAGTGAAAANIGDVEEFHATWRSEESQFVVRLCLSYAMQFRAMVGGFYREEDGNLVLSPPPGEWHRALRYFRLSQSSSDLFDAFRNLYLALECHLNEVAPRGDKEGEGSWLARALQRAYDLVDVPTVLGDLDPGGCELLHEEIWKSVRNPVFHAKDGDSSFLPLDASSREAVRTTLLRCGLLCTAMGEHLHGVRFLSSGISVEAAKMGAEGALDECDIGITDDSSPFDAEDGRVSPTRLPVVLFKARKVEDVEALSGVRVRGRILVDDILKQVESVRRVCTVSKGERVGVVEVLAGDLDLRGADVLEVEWTLSAGGTALKTNYPS
jgi:hypothetical protein